MEHIFVLSSDWNSPKDPVPFYGAAPRECLDFNNRRAKPRVLLAAVDEVAIPDCEYGLPYQVVVCEVQPQASPLWQGEIS